jgi:hypothetical protein
MKLTGTGIDFEQFAVGLNLASFPKATQFVARGKELLKMHELLYGHSSRTCVVLYGLGGMGKTQLAIEYIRRHKEKYKAIFWLNANDQDSLKLSLRDAAQQVLKYHPSTSLLASVVLDDLDRQATEDLSSSNRCPVLVLDSTDTSHHSVSRPIADPQLMIYDRSSSTEPSLHSRSRATALLVCVWLKPLHNILKQSTGQFDTLERPSWAVYLRRLAEFRGLRGLQRRT